MANPRFLVVAPSEDGWEEIDGGKRFIQGGRRYRSLAEEFLSPHGEVRHFGLNPATGSEGQAQLDAALADVDALVVAPWFPWQGVLELGTFDDARLGRATDLKVIAGTFDFRLGWVALDAASAREVTVVDTSRTMTWTVAEFAVAITFALLRDIPAAIETVRAGEWFESPKGEETFVFRDLADCRVGLAGYGSINRNYRRFIAPYGCDVATYDPFVGDDVLEADSTARAATLVKLAERSDILVVAIPPTPTTLGVIDARTIDALAKGSLFVLVSRMAVVEQEALWRRVRAGELRAAVDVFDPEPPPADAWFRREPNVLPTPHIAGNVQFAHERCFREACADAVRVVRGESPLHPAGDRDKKIYDGTMTIADA